MTFSVAGVCPDTGMVGCAITSSSICVTSRCAFVRSDTGVALTQNVTNPDLGPLALDLMNEKCSPQEIMKALANGDNNIRRHCRCDGPLKGLFNSVKRLVRGANDANSAIS